jgi:hypothetical protein
MEAGTMVAVEADIEIIQAAVSAGDFSRAMELPQLQARLDKAKQEAAKVLADVAAAAEAQRAAVAAIAPLEAELSIQRKMHATAETEVMELTRLCADRKQALLML